MQTKWQTQRQTSWIFTRDTSAVDRKTCDLSSSTWSSLCRFCVDIWMCMLHSPLVAEKARRCEDFTPVRCYKSIKDRFKKLIDFPKFIFSVVCQTLIYWRYWSECRYTDMEKFDNLTIPSGSKAFNMSIFFQMHPSKMKIRCVPNSTQCMGRHHGDIWMLTSKMQYISKVSWLTLTLTL